MTHPYSPLCHSEGRWRGAVEDKYIVLGKRSQCPFDATRGGKGHRPGVLGDQSSYHTYTGSTTHICELCGACCGVEKVEIWPRTAQSITVSFEAYVRLANMRPVKRSVLSLGLLQTDLGEASPCELLVFPMLGYSTRSYMFRLGRHHHRVEIFLDFRSALGPLRQSIVVLVRE